MRQSVREFIAEVRRRHQPRSNDAAAREKAESFANFVDRQAIRRRQEVINATFGHHNILPMVTPVAVEAAGNLEQTIALSDDPPSRFKQIITAMRESIAAIFGVRVPDLRVRLNETDLPDGTYIIMLEEIPLVIGNVNPKQLFCLATVAQLVASSGGDWKESDLTAAALPDDSGREGCWISAEHGEKVRSAGFETWDAAAYIEAHLRSLLTDNLDLFAKLDELEQLFLAMEPGEPDAETLLSRLRAAPGGLPRFGEVVRSLLLEQLPIRDLRALTVHYLEVVDALTLDVAEELRRVPTLHAHITRDAAQWRLFTLAEEYEAKIRMGIIARDRPRS
jgi:type III secretory pathway component EscV